MQRLTRPGIATALLAIAGVSLAWAQSTPPGQRSSPMYDLKAETTIQGTVQRVEQVTPANAGRGRAAGGTHLIVRAGSEVLTVHLGPTEYLAGKAITFAEGDSVEILGSRVTIDEESVLLARQIKKGDQTWTLRDESGRPLWRGRGR
jgi:hypothetical protein